MDKIKLVMLGQTAQSLDGLTGGPPGSPLPAPGVGSLRFSEEEVDRTKTDAMRMLNQTVSIRRIMESDNDLNKLAVSHALSHLTNFLMEEENYGEAERRVREALDIKYGSESREILFHQIECTEKLAVILQRQRRFDEAEANYKKSIILRKEVKCLEDPAVYCNLGTIGIARACIHLTQAREILNETHSTKQLAKQAKSDADVLLREAKILLHQSRQYVRAAIHICEIPVNPSTVTPPPTLSPRESINFSHLEVHKDNFPVSVGAKHNFVAIYNYLREIRSLRGKDRGDLTPRRVLSSMQSPLRAIRESRVKSRYEKELKNSPTAHKKTSSFAQDADYVDMISEVAQDKEAEEFLNQLYHRRFTSSGFDWYLLLKRATDDDEWGRPSSEIFGDDDSRKSIRMHATKTDSRGLPISASPSANQFLPLPSPSSSPVSTSLLTTPRFGLSDINTPGGGYDITRELLSYGIGASPPSDPTSPSFSSSSSRHSPNTTLTPRGFNTLSGVFDTISLDSDELETTNSKSSALKRTKHAVDKLGTLIKHGTSFTSSSNKTSNKGSQNSSSSNLYSAGSSLQSTPKSSVDILDQLASFDELIFSDDDDDARFNRPMDFDDDPTF